MRAGGRGPRALQTIHRALLLAAISLPAQAADLLEVYRAAQERDPGFQSARYAFEAVRQRVPQAFSALLPTLGVTANAGRTVGDTAYSGTSTVERGFESYVWTLQLAQPVLRLPSHAAYEAAKATVEQAAAELEHAQQELMLRVAQAYFDVLVAEDGLSAAAAQLSANQEQLTVAQHAFARGTVSVTDVDEAQARADLAVAQSVAAQNELEVRKAGLERIVGAVSDTLSVLEPAVRLAPPEPDRIADWVARAQSTNPDVRALEAGMQAAKAELRRNRLQRLPTIDLVASYGHNYASGNATNPVDYSTRSELKQVGLQLSMPILDGGGLHAATAEARAKAQKAEADLEAARRQSATEAKQAFAGVRGGLSQVHGLESAVAAGERSVKGNQLGYQLGIRINSDVLNSQQQLYSARRDLSRAKHDTLLQGLKLKAAAGQLQESDLAGINKLLIPAASLPRSDHPLDEPPGPGVSRDQELPINQQLMQ